MEETIVIIHWLDSDRDDGWVEVTDDKPMNVCKSVGYLISENEESVSISTTICQSGPQWLSPLRIPKCAIKLFVRGAPSNLRPLHAK